MDERATATVRHRPIVEVIESLWHDAIRKRVWLDLHRRLEARNPQWGLYLCSSRTHWRVPGWERRAPRIPPLHAGTIELALSPRWWSSIHGRSLWVEPLDGSTIIDSVNNLTDPLLHYGSDAPEWVEYILSIRQGVLSSGVQSLFSGIMAGEMHLHGDLIEKYTKRNQKRIPNYRLEYGYWTLKVDMERRGSILFDDPVEASLKYLNVTISKESMHNEAFKWLQNAYSGSVKPKRSVALADCVAATGATPTEAKAALKKIENRRTRGQSG